MTKKIYKSVVYKTTMAVVSLLSMFGLMGFVHAYADQVPAACTTNDFVLNLGQNSTVVYDETSPFGATTITYTVSTGNPNTSGSGCNVDSADINVTTPDGVVHNLQTNGNYPIGTPVTILGTVNYVADSSDKTGQVLITSANVQGDLHDNPVVIDPLNITKQVSALVINPSTITSISSSASAVVAGGTVNLTVTEQNDGDVNLTGAHVDVDNGVGTLSAPPTSGDDGDGILEPGETWSWTVNGVVINADTTFTATGHGMDPFGNDVTFPADEQEQDSVTVTVRAGEYCSPGYWKQAQHFDSWVTYSPTQKFSDVFGESITIMWSSKGKPAPVTDPTLLQALQANGGGINSLARATVGALLNSTSMSYSMTSAEVISAFQNAYPGTNTQYEALVSQFTIPENCPLN